MASITIKAIVPKSKFIVDPRFLRSELFNALDHTANIVRDDFNKTTRTWSNKPTFRKVGPRRKITRMEVEVFTNHDVYFYVTRGTKAHVIKAVRAPRLRFQTGFRSKSRVRVIGSRAGSRFGPTVFAKQVSHPGSKAREFDKEIARRRQKNLNNLVRLALLRAIQHSAS
jgi:hypothetical protein